MLPFIHSPIDQLLGFFSVFPPLLKNSTAVDLFVHMGETFLLGINLEVELATLLFVGQLALRIKPFRMALISYHCALASVAKLTSLLTEVISSRLDFF